MRKSLSDLPQGFYHNIKNGLFFSKNMLTNIQHDVILMLLNKVQQKTKQLGGVHCD